MYQDYYGLHGRPFDPVPHPGVFFPSIAHRKALSHLRYGLGRGEGIVVISGETGTGKTTLAVHLQNTLRPAMTVGCIAASDLGGEGVRDAVLRGLFPHGIDDADFGTLDQLLEREESRGRRCLLLVDDAHGFSVDELLELSTIATPVDGERAPFQLVLLGEPLLAQTISHSVDAELLRRRIIASHRLDPLQPNETESYVRHNLDCAGWSRHPELARSIYLPLHKATRGVPGQINAVMHCLFVLGAREEKSLLDEAMLETVLEDWTGPAVLSHFAAAKDTLAQCRGSRDAAPGMGSSLSAEASGSDQGTRFLVERIERLEARIGEQDAVLRRVLARLVQFLEADKDTSRVEDEISV